MEGRKGNRILRLWFKDDGVVKWLWWLYSQAGAWEQEEKGSSSGRQECKWILHSIQADAVVAVAAAKAFLNGSSVTRGILGK